MAKDKNTSTSTIDDPIRFEKPVEISDETSESLLTVNNTGTGNSLTVEGGALATNKITSTSGITIDSGGDSVTVKDSLAVNTITSQSPNENNSINMYDKDNGNGITIDPHGDSVTVKDSLAVNTITSDPTGGSIAVKDSLAVNKITSQSPNNDNSITMFDSGRGITIDPQHDNLTVSNLTSTNSKAALTISGSTYGVDISSVDTHLSLNGSDDGKGNAIYLGGPVWAKPWDYKHKKYADVWVTLTSNGKMSETGSDDTQKAYWVSESRKASDERLKKNIESMEDNVLEKVLSLRAVNFEWNDTAQELQTQHVQDHIRADNPEDNEKLWDSEKERIKKLTSGTHKGIIAQEVEEVFPEWVEDGENGYKSLDMSELPIVLLKAVKEQQDLLNKRQATLNQQQEIIDTLLRDNELFKKKLGLEN